MNLVAGIEAEIRRYLAVEGGVGVTLKRCAIWVREGTLGLRLMSVIIEDTQGTPPPNSFTLQTPIRTVGGYICEWALTSGC